MATSGARPSLAMPWARLAALPRRSARIAGREVEALVRSFFPLRPDPRRCVRDLGFRKVSELVEYFSNRAEPRLMGFCIETNKEAASEFEQRFPRAAELIRSQADALACGKVELLDHCFSADGSTRWHFDPWSKREVPVRYWCYYRLSTTDPFRDGSVDPMFLWQLHKHQHLCRLGQAYCLTGDEKYADSLISHLQDWMECFSVGHGFPYLLTLTVAQRLISWCILYTLMKQSKRFMETMFPSFLHSMSLQARFIRRNLSFHGRTNNFIIAESTALRIIGLLFPELPEARQWEDEAVKILQRELPKQIHSDGVSFEQSTGYHRFVAELLVILNLCDRAQPTKQVGTGRELRGMLRFLMHLAGPDGRIPQFGDVSVERGFWLSPVTDICQVRDLLAIGSILCDDPHLKSSSGGAADTVFWLMGQRGLEAFDRVPAEPCADASILFPEGGGRGSQERAR